MAASNFSKCLALVLKHEGGLSMIRSDPGNWTGGRVGVGQLRGTKYGVAANTFPHLDIPNLTVAQAGDIYRERYWSAVRGDDLPLGVDMTTFDYAVNSGPARAIMALQRVVGVADDGKIGPITLAAINKAHPDTIIRKLCMERLSFLRRLSTWGTFGRGWSNRVAGVESEALKMAAVKAPVAPPDVEPVSVQPKPSVLARIGGWLAS